MAILLRPFKPPVPLMRKTAIPKFSSAAYRNAPDPSVPGRRNGLPASGVKVPSGATDHPSVMMEEAKLASPPYKRSPAQLKSSPETNPVPVRGNGELADGVSDPSALML